MGNIATIFELRNSNRKAAFFPEMRLSYLLFLSSYDLYIVISGDTAVSHTIAIIHEEDVAEGALGDLHGREGNDGAAARAGCDLRDAGVIFLRDVHGDEERRRCEEKACRAAADTEDTARPSGQRFLHEGNAEHRERRRHDHQGGTKGSPRRKGGRRKHQAVIHEAKDDEEACVAHFRPAGPHVPRLHRFIHGLYGLPAESEGMAGHCIDEDHPRQVDRHFFKARHDVRKLIDYFRRRFAKRREHAGDERVPNGVPDESARRIGDQQNDDRRQCRALAQRHAALSFRQDDALLCQKIPLQNAPHEQQKADQREQVEEHLPISRELIADMDQEPFTAALLAVAHPVPRRGHQPQ